MEEFYLFKNKQTFRPQPSNFKRLPQSLDQPATEEVCLFMYLCMYLFIYLLYL